MRQNLWKAVRIAASSAVAWAVAGICSTLDVSRPIGSMLLLLVVLGTATAGDWLLAVLTSISASLAYNWYFVETVGSFSITTVEGGVSFFMMLLTAMTGSHLSVRAQRRAAEAIHRREEMDRLHRLGNALLASGSVAEAAGNIVVNVVRVFGQAGARLLIDGTAGVFEAGNAVGPPGLPVQLQSGVGKSVLELYGTPPSPEVCSAIANLVNLVLDRARAAEDRARIEAAQRGEELRNTVLNALAHNFKTPLTSIKAAASILRGAMLSGSAGIPQDAQRDLVVVIDEEADRLDQLISESLDVARIEARRENPRMEACSVSSVVSAVSSRVFRYLGGRQLSLDVPEELPPIQGDPFLLEQMLMQVVDNAWKYSRPGSLIRIEGDSPGDGNAVVLKVHNEGSSIPEDEKERIFGKFYRGAASRSQVEGTGLGLAISRSIAEAHGGKMWLESEPAGPVFCFLLPSGAKEGIIR